MMKKLSSIFLTVCLLFNILGNINVYANEGDKSINVNIAVVGMYNEVLFKPQKVKVNYERENPTAEDALKATGLKTQIKDSGFIESIEGQNNGIDDGNYNSQSRWMYKVNFIMPKDVARTENIKDDDYLLFYYAKSASDLLPSYDSSQNDFINVTVKSIQKDNSFNEKVTVLKNNSVNAAIMEALKRNKFDFDKAALGDGVLITSNDENMMFWSYILNADKSTYNNRELQLKDGDTITAYKDNGDFIGDEPEKDTEKPVINVDNLTNGQTTINSDLSFKVTVADNVDKNIVPIVKINNDVVTGTDGTYKVTLKEGENVIAIEATDVAGNKSDSQYKIIYKVSSINSYKIQLDKNLEFILKNVKNPKSQTNGGDWSVISLARGNYPVPNDYYERYYNNVTEQLKKCKGILDTTKYTEYSRLILGLTAIGRDVSNVAGYNQLEKLADYDNVIFQGINGSIFALIALDSKNYEIPKAAANIKVQNTRDKLIDYILDVEINKGKENAGGWALYGEKADIDITAMAIQALTPYCKTNNNVKVAVDRAINWLSNNQEFNGGYKSWGTENSESIAQVIIALTGLGIDPYKDTRFIKNKNTLIDALLSYAVPNGGFMHTITAEKEANAMATDQGTLALVAYDRFINGKAYLYNMTDVEIQNPVVIGVTELLLPDGDKPEVKVPNDSEKIRECKISIGAKDKKKEIKIEIPKDKNSKVIVELQFKNEIPKIEAVKGNVSAVIPQNTNVTSGDVSTIEMITTKDITDKTVIDKVNTVIPNGKKFESIDQVFSMGGSSNIEFDKFITLTLKDMKGKSVAYIQNGTLHSIEKYTDELAGQNSGKNEYAYDDGNNLIIKTKHFTDFIVYTTSTISSGGGTTPTERYYINLSVDKLTINKGYVINPTSVEIQPGDTAWTVLKRELDRRGIGCRYEWTEMYGSVYVQSIDGDGEFDHGRWSGWMYNVNGIYPGFGSSKYVLKNGDVMQWRYTTNLGADIGQDLSQWTTPPSTVEQQEGKAITIDVPKDIKTDFDVNLNKDTKSSDNITINLPDVKSKVFVNLENVKNDMPKITTIKGDISVLIDKGTKITYGDSKAELLTSISKNDAQVVEAINKKIGREFKCEKINNAFTLGDRNKIIVFDQPITLILKNAKGQSVGYIIRNEFTPFKIFESEKRGAYYTKNDILKDYAYIAENDLIIKTNHFNTYITYEEKNKEANLKKDSEKEGVIDTEIKEQENKNSKKSNKAEVQKYIDETAALMKKNITNPVVASVGGEWTVLSLARSGVSVENSYYEKYNRNVEKTLKGKEGKLHHVKYTEYDRVILALSSVGKKVDDVVGYNLLKPLADFNTVIKQGLNGPIWALIALDSCNYEIPEDKSVVNQSTREKFVDYILDKELPGGGWSLTSKAPADTDITAMALTALSKYQNNEKVKAATNRALSYLSKTQDKDGKYKSAWGDENSSESIAQVIVALTALNIDPKIDERFIKNGNDTISALLTFYSKGGGFKHVLSGSLDAMATDQGMYALVAYNRFVNEQKNLFDMTDVLKK